LASSTVNDPHDVLDGAYDNKLLCASTRGIDYGHRIQFLIAVEFQIPFLCEARKRGGSKVVIR
jgi:hypothetical protein